MIWRIFRIFANENMKQLRDILGYFLGFVLFVGLMPTLMWCQEYHSRAEHDAQHRNQQTYDQCCHRRQRYNKFFAIELQNVRKQTISSVLGIVVDKKAAGKFLSWSLSADISFRD